MTGDRGLRLAWCTNCTTLDDAGRIEALRLRAAQRGLQLPQETSEYLLRRMRAIYPRYSSSWITLTRPR